MGKLPRGEVLRWVVVEAESVNTNAHPNQIAFSYRYFLAARSWLLVRKG